MQGYFDEYGNWIEGPLPEQEGQAPPAPALEPELPWRRNRNQVPGSTWEEDGRTRNLDPNSEWVWDDQWGEWKVQPKSIANPTTTTEPPPPPPPPPPPVNPSGEGDDWGYLTEPFTGTPPAWTPGPTYTAPTYEPPPPFSYEKFAAPTPESIYADPSYQFRFGEGQKALGQHKASTGTYLTGGTMKDFLNYGQNAASQEYSNIFGRAVDAHNLGLTQALGEYGVNYGVSKDQRDYLFDTSKAEFAPQQREHEQMNEREFANFLANYDIFEKNRKRAGDVLFQAAGMGGQ